MAQYTCMKNVLKIIEKFESFLSLHIREIQDALEKEVTKHIIICNFQNETSCYRIQICKFHISDSHINKY